MSLNNICQFNQSAQDNFHIACDNLQIKCNNGDLLSYKPPDNGTAGQILATDGIGQVFWTANGGGGGSGNMIFTQPSTVAGNHYKASNTTGLLTEASVLNEDATTFNFSSKNLISTNTIETGGFIKTGGTNAFVLLADGTTAPYTTGGGNSNYYLYQNDTDITVPPSTNGHIQYNNTIQQNATIVWINHLTQDGVDIDAYLALINNGDFLYIQDKNSSLNWIEYTVVSTTIIPNNYISITVVFKDGEANGLTSFGNNHPIFFSVFNNIPSINLRLSQLENKTQYQSVVLSNETNFTGTVLGDIIQANQFVKIGATSSQYLMGDGSIQQGLYNIVSQGTGETLLKNGTGHDFTTKSLKVGAGLGISSTVDEITITNTSANNTTITNAGSGVNLQTSTSANPNFAFKSISNGSGISFTEVSNNIQINNSSMASSITLTNSGSGVGSNTLLASSTNPNFSTKGIIAGSDITITTTSNDLTIINNSPASTISVNNSGSGSSLINSSSTVNPNFYFKSFSVGSGISLTDTTNNLSITNSSPASGISLSSVGIGNTLIPTTSSNPAFQTKSLIAGSGILITNNANDLTIENTGSAGSISITSTGVGTSIIKSNANPTYVLKGLSGGTGVTITNNTNDLSIATNTTLTNGGTGNTLVATASANPTLQTKGIIAGTNTTISSTGTDLTINAINQYSASVLSFNPIQNATQVLTTGDKKWWFITLVTQPCTVSGFSCFFSTSSSDPIRMGIYRGYVDTTAATATLVGQSISASGATGLPYTRRAITAVAGQNLSFTAGEYMTIGFHSNGSTNTFTASVNGLSDPKISFNSSANYAVASFPATISTSTILSNNIQRPCFELY